MKCDNDKCKEVRHAWRSIALRQWRLHEDVERELGLEPSHAAEENVERGLAAIRELKAEVERLRARVAELEHPRSHLPPGVERAEAVYAGDVLEAEHREALWALERVWHGLASWPTRAEYARTICREARKGGAR